MAKNDDPDDDEWIGGVEECKPVHTRTRTGIRLRSRGRRRQRLAVDHAHYAIDAVGNAAGEIAAAEFRRDDLVDDALGGHIGQRAFEAVTDLDAQLAVV